MTGAEATGAFDALNAPVVDPRELRRRLSTEQARVIKAGDRPDGPL